MVLTAVLPAGTGVDAPDLGPSGIIDVFEQGTTVLDFESGNNDPTVLKFSIPIGAQATSATVKAQGLLPYQPVKYGVGSDPQVLGTGDFNRDGWIDVVTADKTSGDTSGGADTVSVLLNDKKGGLTGGGRAQTYQVGDGPVDMVVVDLDMDGHEDIAVVESNSETLTVLPNGASQAFNAAKRGTYSVEGTPVSVDAGDMDGDGDNDIVAIAKKTVSFYDNVTGTYTYKDITKLIIYTNDGSGGFSTHSSSTLDLTPMDMVAHDMDGDGDTDLVVANSRPPFSIKVMSNDGAGVFDDVSSFNVPGVPQNVVIGDLEGNGMPDMVVVSPEAAMAVFTNLGDGAFSRKEYPDASNTVAVEFNDIDQDGLPDILAVDRAQNSVTVMVNDGKGGLVYDTVFFIGNNPTDIVSLDADMDGDLDIATCNVGDETVSLMLNSGTGTFQWYETVYIKATGEIMVGDWDDDGDNDVLSSNYNDHSLTIAPNEGDGTFTRENVDYMECYKIYAGGVGGCEPFFPTPADYDNDGDLDVVYGEELSYSIIMMENDGKGKFTQYSAALDDNNIPLLPAPPFQTTASDLDGDGDLDLISNHINHKFLSILLNDGNGVFTTWLNQSNGNHSSYDYVLRDLDGDGDDDIITSNYGNGSFFEDTISFLRNEGNARFTHVKDFKVDKAPRTIDMADVDNDGKEDIILGHSFKPEKIDDIKPSTISVLITRAIDIRAGSVVADFDVWKYNAGLLPGYVHAEDIEGDGDIDIYCLNQGVGRGGTLSVFINDGTGKFGTAIDYSGFPDKFHIFTDFDGDGRNELLIPSSTEHFSIYWNMYYPGDLNVTVGNNGFEVDDLDLRGDGTELNLTEVINKQLDLIRATTVDPDPDPHRNVTITISIRNDQRGVMRLSDLEIVYQPHAVEGDGDDGPEGLFDYDLTESGTQMLVFFLVMLIIVSMAIKAPKPPEEVPRAKNMKPGNLKKRYGKKGVRKARKKG